MEVNISQNVKEQDASGAAQNAEVTVTTEDIAGIYMISGPVNVCVSNWGGHEEAFRSLVMYYEKQLRQEGHGGSWSSLDGESAMSGDEFDMAAYIAVRELQRRARALGADAVIGMRQQVVFSQEDPDHFALHAYGTAVRTIREAAAATEKTQQVGDFVMEDTLLVRYTGKMEYIRIPDDTITIGPEAFHNSTVINVEMPDTVEEIDEGAFSGCENLTRVKLSPRLRVIRKNAFQGCINLHDINIPEALEEMDSTAFALCPEIPAVRDFISRKEAEAKDAEYLRIRRPVWRRQGRCQYCGGFFKGGLKGTKICSMCGMEKDY